MIEFANAVRGEVELELAGTSFVLRPSYEAVEACEVQTGMSLTDLAIAADSGALKLGAAVIVVTELVRAWGKETKTNSVAGVQREKVAKLIYAMGVMIVLPRLAIVLLRAASGGVDASGKLKPIPETTTPPGIGDALPGSPEQPSDGPPPNSGRARRTSSSRRSKPGSK